MARRYVLFDAVIGNTDRHQDNWGFVFAPGHQEGPVSCRIAPLFDNGTSLGHERFADRVKNWSDADCDRYIACGTHHIGKRRETGASTEKHPDLVGFIVDMWPATRAVLVDRLTLLETGLPELLDDLGPLGGPVAFSPDRAAFVRRLLERRIALLQGIINEPHIPHP
ncbi:hypothetical protein [Paraburkholderia sp. J41]|uniref:hypothetical protein n=1 Tax=Paraburkholderia sp. J41 TaxID=2805433 RepID=UPI002AC32A1C|nr:hypothetical protein [Paraburkholderia sp. J41]